MSNAPNPARSGGPISVALLVSDGLGSPGGIGRVMTYLAAALQASAPDLTLHDIATRGRRSGIARHLSVVGAWASFRRRARAGEFDIAHINVARKGSTWRKLLYAAAARAAGAKVILHLHGSGYDGWYAMLPLRVQRRIASGFRAADAVVVLGELWRRFVIEQLGVDPGRVHYIPNGVPDPGETARPSQWPERPHILFLGELGPRKGTDVLVPALARLAAQGRDFRATLAGNGEIGQTRAAVAEAGLAHRIAVPGWTGPDGTRALLGDADIFTLPSRAENQPVSILEAMAASLPVVSTHVGAIPDEVVEGVNGYLVPPGDTAALAAALDRLLTDGDTARAMGRAGRKRYREQFEIGVCANRMAALYRHIAHPR